MMIRAVVLLCGFLLCGTGSWRLEAQEALLRGTCKDAVTGLPTPCTVAITDATGKLVLEHESFTGGFRCAGQFSKRLPAGRTRVRITRGFETRAIDQEFELLAGSETNVTFTLRRMVDLRQRGWYGGDSHAHMLHGERTVPVDFDFVALTARAEDLQYLSLAQAWSIERATPEALEAELERRSRPDCVLTWNLEAPKNYYKGDAGRCLGHCWTLGLRARTGQSKDLIGLLLEASAWDYESSKPSYANFESHRLIHDQGGAVFYTHPARWWMGSWGGQGGYPKVERMRVSNMAVELPLDTLVGPTYDGVDLLTTSGERAANARAFRIWSMLLNHGYRLAATASSDSCFDRRGGGVPGAARTYTYLPDGFSLSKVARATAAGRTFVTTGPLLIAQIDGKPPGTAFAAGAGTHQLTIEAWAGGEASDGLESLDILRNGEPWKWFVFSDRPECARTNLTMRESQNAWYCVRAVGHGAQGPVAVSGAFYFADEKYRPPVAADAQVSARILDARSGQLLAGSLVEVAFSGKIPRDRKRHRLKTGETRLSVPATVRLRAEAPGYDPLTLSPFLDCPRLVQYVTSLKDDDLGKWETYEAIRRQLADIKLDFQLIRR